MRLEEERIKGEAAQQLLSNPILKDAFVEIRKRLEERRLNAKPTELEMCADAIRVEQLLTALERQIRAFVETGKMADFELQKPKLVHRFMR